MKNTILKFLIILTSVILFTACNGKSGDMPTEFPTCTITQSTPLSHTQITVHVVCSDGNIDIDEATVTVDGQVKPLDFEGANIDDYITFTNLQDDTIYTVVLDGIVDGEVFTDSIDIKTNDIPLEVDTTPPVIIITGGTIQLTVGGDYTAPVVTASDDVDGNITSSIVEAGDIVDPKTIGTYVVTYNVTDSSGNTAIQQTHTVVVSAAATPPPPPSSTNPPSVNTAPTARDDFTNTDYNTSVLVDVLTNDTDSESTISLSGVIANEVGGTAVVENAKIRFTPRDGFEGTASFDYEIQDRGGISDTAMVTIEVADAPIINTPPTATDATADVNYGEIVSYDLASDIDDEQTDDSGLTITVLTDPSEGSLSWNGTEFTYTTTPLTEYAGDDSFTYKVTDPEGSTSADRTVSIINIIEDGS